MKLLKEGMMKKLALLIAIVSCFAVVCGSIQGADQRDGWGYECGCKKKPK